MQNVTPLPIYLRNELVRRGESKKDFARRNGISLSNLYLVLEGADNVRRETFEKIATGLGITPAELAAVTEGGGPSLSPDETETVVLYRQLPSERREWFRDLLRASAVPPTRLTTNRGRLDTTKRQQPGVGQSGNNQGEGPKRPRKGTLPRHYPSTRVPLLGAFGRLLSPAVAL
jgi:transcriptional regulator with XRE-family HTH domain